MHPRERLPFSPHREPPAAALPRGHPAGGVAGALAGGLGPVAADGAHGDLAAAGRAAAARPAELELARVRHARRLLAAARRCSSASAPGRPSPSTRRSARPTRRWCEACMESGWELNAHSYEQIPMHKLDDQRAVIAKTMSIDREVLGQAPARLVRARPDADLRHGRLPGRGRHRVHRRLRARRRSGHARRPSTGRWWRCPTPSRCTTSS